MYINTKAQPADLFTKQLSPKVHWTLTQNIMNIPAQTREPTASAQQNLKPRRLAFEQPPAAAAAAHTRDSNLIMFCPAAPSLDSPEGGCRAGTS